MRWSSFVLVLGAVSFVHSDFATHFVKSISTESKGAQLEQTASAQHGLSINMFPTGTSSTASGISTGLAGVTGVDHNITSWAYLWGWTNCNKEQKAAVLDGLSEAHTILSTHGVYSIDDHWNDFATVEYLGSPYFAKQNDRRANIEGMTSL